MGEKKLLLPWERGERIRDEMSRWVVFLVFVVVMLILELWGLG